MPKAMQLHIPQPCHENWHAMSPKEQGRFCGSCQKTVVDFSMMTDKEIVVYISRATHQVCGRFSNTQLNKDLPLTEKKKRFSWTYLWNVLLATFLVTDTSAQVKPSKKANTVIRYDNTPMIQGDVVFVKSPDLVLPTDITGTVTDEANGKAVPGVSVIIKGTNKGTITDSLGNFHLSVEKKDSVILTFSSIGYKTQTRILNDQTNWEAVKVSMPVIETDLIMVGGITPRYKMTKYEKVKTAINKRLPSFLKKDVQIYPTPVVRGYDIHINLSLKQAGNYKLELLDIDGRVVWVQPLVMTASNQQANIPTQASWSKGIYWVRISSPKSKDVYQGKVLLQ